MNQLIIIGNLTGDPEHRTTRTGKSLASFTVAVTRRNDRDKTDFFRVSAWGELGEICTKYLTKGKKVAVTGAVSVNAYTGTDGTARGTLEVMAQGVEFLSPREQPAEEPAPTRPNEDPGKYMDGEDDLPF